MLMKFDGSQRNPVALILFLVMVGGLFGAIFLGSSVGKGEFLYLAVGFGVAGLIGICLVLRTNIWMLIPLCLLLTGSTGGGRIPFSVSELSILLSFGMYLVFYAMKSIPKFARANFCDLLLYLNLAYLATVFLRNPVGVAFIKSHLIGGRPYFTIVIALMGYWVLQHVTPTPKQGKLVPIFVALGATATSVIGMLTAWFPQLVPIIYPFYTGLNIGSYMKESQIGGTQAEGLGRQDSLKGFAYYGGGALVSFFRPIELLLFLRPLWSVLFYGTLAAILLTGFRSGLVGWAVLVMISSYFRGGISDVLKISFAGFIGICLLMAAKTGGMDVPLPIQRAVSFILPDLWDSPAVANAADSAEWRFEMWRVALTNSRFIKNRILGDGFGFDPAELTAFQNISSVGSMATPEQFQEYFLITGVYHSGPVNSIRNGGAIGLLLLTALMLACARYAWKVMRSAKGSPFFPLALFVGAPALYLPFEFWLVYGAYDSGYVQVLFLLPMLNLTVRGLDKWRSDQAGATSITIAPSANSFATSPTAGQPGYQL